MSQPPASTPQDQPGRALLGDLVEAVRDPDNRPWGLSVRGREELRERLASLSPAEHVAVLRAAVAEMPYLRRPDASPAERERGPLVYAVAVHLYSSRSLPLGEADLADLLINARHDCGHGADTRPPFDRARAWMRKHGYSPVLGAAIATFAENLPRSSSVKVHELRRAAALLSILESDAAAPGKRAVWLDAVRAGIAATAGDERVAWQDLVVKMTGGYQYVPPPAWTQAGARHVARLGRERVEQRLTEWWPAPSTKGTVNLGSAGGALLKHFIWLLDDVGPDVALTLGCALAEMRWEPAPPMAVIKPAIALLARLDPQRAAAELASLNALAAAQQEQTR